MISSIRLWNPLYSLHRIIFWGINQQESHDERLRDQFFSFKLQLTQSSEGHEAAAPSLKVIPQHIPTFKPINFREDKKNELPCYEASDLTLEDITGGYPEAIEVIVHELEEAVEKGIEMLPEKSRTIFKLNRIEGLSNSEIAKRINLSEKSVEYHITKSLKQLKQSLRDFLVSIILLIAFIF